MSEPRGRIAVFVRPIVAGQTKTRLSPALGDDGAARLYAAFVQDVIATCTAVAGADVELWVAGDPDHASLCAHDLPRWRQPQTDLGDRMARALAHRPGPTVVVGSDAPTLPVRLLSAALSALRDSDVVLGPAADGGFTLIGASDAQLPLGAGIRWSHPRTLADTLSALRRSHLRVAQLTPWYDVDTPEDLRVLSMQLALQPQAAPATAVVLETLRRAF